MLPKITNSFKAFTNSEKNAGLLLLFCTCLSLFLSNINIGESYRHFWHQNIGFSIANFDLHYSIEHWINDGLMTIFFLMVGLEIERELYAGELYPLKNALLPIFGAIGGMLVPALIFIALNYNTNTLNGFGIPMGTDIAFALAVLSLAGNRVPASIKILLTAIAIIDDLGSILIIAIFYGSSINYLFLSISIGIFLLLILLNKLNVSHLSIYLLLGIGMWFFMMQSGIHPTISGVLLAFAIPFGKGQPNSISIKLQHALHIPVAFIILPLFTLANTAIPVNQDYINSLISPHALGILLGLLLGKPVGIILTSFTVIKLNLLKLPQGVNWFEMIAMSCLAGIGFTMSIFITQLAYTETSIIQSSKLMILITSCLAGIIGYLLFAYSKSNNTDKTN